MLKKNIGLEDVMDVPVEFEVNGKKYLIQHPPMGLVAMIENKRTQIINTDTQYMTLYMQKLTGMQMMKEEEVKELEEKLNVLLKEFIMKKFDIAAEIVQLILEGRKPDGEWKVSKDEIMWEWGIDKVLEVIEIYNRLVDMSDFFSKLTKKKEADKEEKQTGETSSSQ